MTKLFDDKAREEFLNNFFPEQFEYNNSPVSEMTIKKIPPREARKYIATYHYTKTFPDSTKYCYAGYLGETFAGVVVYGMGSGKNQYTALIPEIKNGQYLELTRLWSPDTMPRNTESKLIAESLKYLPSEIKLIVSFADPSRKHVGTIYQATNWLYCGTSNGGKVLITEDGIEKHPRLIGIYRMRHPELKDKSVKEIMEMYGWKYGVSYGKHRYVMVRGTKKEKKEMLLQLKDKISPYPKLT